MTDKNIFIVKPNVSRGSQGLQSTNSNNVIRQQGFRSVIDSYNGGGYYYEGEVKRMGLRRVPEGKGKLIYYYDKERKVVKSVIECNFLDGKPNGKGKITYFDEQKRVKYVDEGNFLNGKLQGEVTRTYGNVIINCEFLNGDLMKVNKVVYKNEKGEIKYTEEGKDFYNGKLQGEGTRIYYDEHGRTECNGVFVDGAINEDNGELIRYNKQNEVEYEYTGMIDENGKPYGQGTLIYYNKQGAVKCEGFFINGELTDKGIVTYYEKKEENKYEIKSKFECNFEKGRPNGQGIFSNYNKQGEIEFTDYITLKEGEPYSNRRKYPNGDVYEGDFGNTELYCGTGNDANSKVCIDFFTNREINGKCIFTHNKQNGVEIEYQEYGIFKDKKLNGPGETRYFANTVIPGGCDIVRSIFVNGEPNGQTTVIHKDENKDIKYIEESNFINGKQDRSSIKNITGQEAIERYNKDSLELKKSISEFNMNNSKKDEIILEKTRKSIRAFTNELNEKPYITRNRRQPRKLLGHYTKTIISTENKKDEEKIRNKTTLTKFPPLG